MRKILIIVFSSIFLWACSTGVNEEKRWLKNYNEFLLKFPKKDWGHFPFDFTNFSSKKITVYPQEASKYHLMAGLILDTRVNNAYLMEFLNLLEIQDFIKISMASDSIYFIGDTLQDSSRGKNKYILPDFSDFPDEYGLSSKKLSGKEEVFIIEIKQGEFMNPEFMVNNINTPNGWNHGMSKGIVLDRLRKRIVYWLIYW